ncbi:MAG: DNA-binding transcriptional regulator [Candidatus Fluviicola riflensis]|nr:MAG: DNA-binding transcriptional regulator [Candidatus Fluviicola riflensis]OGS76056.1 MAG: DNA-binding transcriptional regulator [Candidatus Fluviicola riflensis]OGS81956.1 MAG: DNA-binding transcriptional regulator [Fluviicola sp. RIFCSPHIGHO2_01_FULL_43_53]OGS83394.1 MAG: DNA-binding transcriptional regulator [Fluviicola sp. RIFCSPHIGHO2_12_FULL_43_24]
MNRIDRLFGILTLLQSKKFVTAEQLSDRFEISVRTVYRDIKALGESGIPISFEPNKGYFVVQGYFLSPIAFTTEEANALILTESLVSGFTDKSTQAHFGTALTKVKTVLKTVQKEHADHLSSSIRLQVPERLSPEFDFIPVIQEAITTSVQLEIGYLDFKDESSKRAIEPIGLVFYAFSWHVIGWCHLRGAYRDFKLSRINQLRLTRKCFEKTDHIPLGEYQLPVNY